MKMYVWSAGTYTIKDELCKRLTEQNELPCDPEDIVDSHYAGNGHFTFTFKE